MFIFTIIQLTLLSLAVCSISRFPILIVVSYDGFRYNYFNPSVTPNMIRFRHQGTFADYMNSVFPTKTFPNHFTIVTGLYSETHGVVGNSFYDPVLKKVISIGAEMFTQNKQVVPTWILNEMAAPDRYSGVMMWPGCDAAFQNRTPTHVEHWSHEYDIFRRVDKVIEWLTHPEKPANFIALYLEVPDYYSHHYDPESDQVMEKLRILDNLTQYLDDQLHVHNLKDKATVVHLSDHGMAGVKYKNIISLNQFLNNGTYQYFDTSPTLHLKPTEGQEDEVYNALEKASQTLGTFDVYKKEELPDRWHLKNNVRAPPILLLAKEGYGFQDLEYIFKKMNQSLVTPETEVGVHGYDPEVADMRAFFMIRGPHVKRNHLIQPFSNIELYNLFADILKIASQPNNGTVALYKDIFVFAEYNYGLMSVLFMTVGGVVLSLLLISCAAAITIYMIKRQQSMTTTAALNKRFPQTFQQSIEAQHLLETEEA